MLQNFGFTKYFWCLIVNIFVFLTYNILWRNGCAGHLHSNIPLIHKVLPERVTIRVLYAAKASHVTKYLAKIISKKLTVLFIDLVCSQLDYMLFYNQNILYNKRLPFLAPCLFRVFYMNKILNTTTFLTYKKFYKSGCFGYIHDNVYFICVKLYLILVCDCTYTCILNWLPTNYEQKLCIYGNLCSQPWFMIV